jgi:subtilisin family serine protease
MRLPAHLLLVLPIVTQFICLKIQATSSYAEGELLVKWRDGPESYTAAIGNAQIGARVKRSFKELGWQHVELPDGISVRTGVEVYRALDTVLAVEPNGVVAIEVPPERPVRPSAPIEGDNGEIRDLKSEISKTVGLRTPTTAVIPNDPMFTRQWYLQSIGAPDAWSLTTGGTNVVVVIPDTGVDYTHPELAPNMWRNPGETGLDANGNDKATNGIDDDGNGYINDVYGVNVVTGSGDPMDTGITTSFGKIYHGTFIAGLIGAVGNNGRGVAGLNWSSQIMAIHMAGDDGSKPFSFNAKTSLAALLASWDYVLTLKRRGVNIRVVTMSFSLGTLFSSALRDAVTAAGDEGILLVHHAGNDPADGDLFPGYADTSNLKSVLVVAASTAYGALTDWSAFGRSTVHLAAPGENILSTWKGGGYRTDTGTSYSTPLVAGAAALLLSVSPHLTVDQLKGALLGSVDQHSSMRSKLVTNGRLNVARALEYLTNPNPPAIVIYAAPAGGRTEADDPIRVTFNRPMNRNSVESAFRIEPSIAGEFKWSDDNRSFLYQHDGPFDVTTNYTVRILGTAEDEAGATLDGNFNRNREGSPDDDYIWTFRFRIPNDDFTNARLIVGAAGTVQGSNRSATPELGEPPNVLNDYDKVPRFSVWYHWIAPEPGGWVTFDLTDGLTFDSLLAVYTGDHIDALRPVAANDNYGIRRGSRVSFRALAGTNYSIVVDKTFDNWDPKAPSDFKLSWYSTPRPSFNSSEFSPQSGTPGTKITLSGTNFTGAVSVLFNGAKASFTNAATTNLDLRLNAIVPPDATSGPITIVTPHGDVTSSAAFQVLPPGLWANLRSPGEIAVTWPATSNAFVLEASDSLTNPVWTQVTNHTVVSDGLTEVKIPSPPGNRFFRLKSM